MLYSRGSKDLGCSFKFACKKYSVFDPNIRYGMISEKLKIIRYQIDTDIVLTTRYPSEING